MNKDDLKIYDFSRHPFTSIILEILEENFGEHGKDIFESSAILGYLNYKTRSANRGSKSRSSFANHYALYVLVEDYINKGFATGEAKEPYTKYPGAIFSDLLRRQRELPFGAKLQNHALNSRLNDEFRKYFPGIGKPPIVRDLMAQRYWIHEDLLQVTIRIDGKDVVFNIAEAVIKIIDAYVERRKADFKRFLETCRQITELGMNEPQQAIDFVIQQLKPDVDARVFEIVSFAVLKAKFGKETVWIGNTRESIVEECLVLYKTGRTNANDGGIDFVMKPLGRFFQVTETIDVSKYFLDIDKVQKFPVTFVVKSDMSENQIRSAIYKQAIAKYKIESVVDSYMSAVEKIINTGELIEAFRYVVSSGQLQGVMDEIVMQCRVEFNYSEDDEDEDEDVLTE